MELGRVGWGGMGLGGVRKVWRAWFGMVRVELTVAQWLMGLRTPC